MPRIIKSSLIATLVFGIIWLAVIIWWQESHALPTAVDIGLYLLALPLAVLFLGWLGIKTVRAARAPKSAAPAAASAAGAPQAADRAAQLLVLASAAVAAAGATPSAIRQALAQQQRPELDPKLNDANGFPIFAARVADLDTATLRAQARKTDAVEPALDDEPLRGSALLRRVVEDARDQAIDHVVTHVFTVASTTGVSTAVVSTTGVSTTGVSTTDTPVNRPGEKDSDWPMLHIDLMLPGNWDPAARERAATEARSAATAAAWPATRISLASHAVEDEAAVPRHLHALANSAAANLAPALRIVAACDSYISEARTRQWQSQGRLMTSSQPQGLVPGEAAAALLLAALPEATRRPDALLMTLSPFAQRQVQADARGAGADATVPDLTRAMLEEHQIQADSLAALISEADHRGSRPLETMGLASTLLTHLDPVQDCPAVGNRCGYTGAASALLVLALAADASTDAGAPVLAALMQDPTLRGVALVATPDQYPPKNSSDHTHHDA